MADCHLIFPVQDALSVTILKLVSDLWLSIADRRLAKVEETRKFLVLHHSLVAAILDHEYVFVHSPPVYTHANWKTASPFIEQLYQTTLHARNLQQEVRIQLADVTVKANRISLDWRSNAQAYVSTRAKLWNYVMDHLAYMLFIKNAYASEIGNIQCSMSELEKGTAGEIRIMLSMPHFDATIRLLAASLQALGVLVKHCSRDLSARRREDKPMLAKEAVGITEALQHLRESADVLKDADTTFVERVENVLSLVNAWSLYIVGNYLQESGYASAGFWCMTTIRDRLKPGVYAKLEQQIHDAQETLPDAIPEVVAKYGFCDPPISPWPEIMSTVPELDVHCFQTLQLSLRPCQT